MLEIAKTVRLSKGNEGNYGLRWNPSDDPNGYVTTIVTARLGGNVLYPWDTVTLAVYIPAHEATRQWTVKVRGWKN